MSLTELPTDGQVWGPIFWYVLQLFALGLGPEPSVLEQLHLAQAFEAFAELLPHTEIREAYRQCVQLRPVSAFAISDQQAKHWISWVQRKLQSHHLIPEPMPPMVALDILPASSADWGGKVWMIMEFIALSLGPQPSVAQQGAAQAFYEALQSLLPCEECRGHYQELWHIRPSTNFVKTSNDCLYWVNWVHRRVRLIQSEATTVSRDMPLAVPSSVPPSVSPPVPPSVPAVSVPAVSVPAVSRDISKKSKYLKPVTRGTADTTTRATTPAQSLALQKLARATLVYRRPCSC